MDLWLGGLFCLFVGLGLLMAESEKLPAVHFQNKWCGAAYGCGVTALLQSSSAVSCSVCSMASAKKISLAAAFAVLVGSNVGTCITPILTALGLLSDIPKSSFAVVGLLFFTLRTKWRRASSSVIGLCLLMWGMKLMSDAPALFTALSQNTWWSRCIASPLSAFAIGLLSTAVLQSSSLTLGLLQVYSLSAPLSVGIALPFILGQNIGTTTTALLVTHGGDPMARECARFHLRFNVLGAVWGLPLCLALFPLLTMTASPLTMALLQLLYNVVCALLHLCFDKKIKF